MSTLMIEWYPYSSPYSMLYNKITNSLNMVAYDNWYLIKNKTIPRYIDLYLRKNQQVSPKYIQDNKTDFKHKNIIPKSIWNNILEYIPSKAYYKNLQNRIHYKPYSMWNKFNKDYDYLIKLKNTPAAHILTNTWSPNIREFLIIDSSLRKIDNNLAYTNKYHDIISSYVYYKKHIYDN